MADLQVLLSVARLEGDAPPAHLRLLEWPAGPHRPKALCTRVVTTSGSIGTWFSKLQLDTFRFSQTCSVQEIDFPISTKVRSNTSWSFQSISHVDNTSIWWLQPFPGFPDAPRVPKIHVYLCCLSPWMGVFRQSDLGVPHFFKVSLHRMEIEK